MQLYIHIPFCARKCFYCDFLSFPIIMNKDKSIVDKYINALICELKSYTLMMDEGTISTVYIGGGTPSILEEKQLAAICDCIGENFKLDANAEVSMECNPGTVTKEKLRVYRECGINRLSLGLQSAINSELKSLGRIHTYEDFLNSYGMARNAGFNNINIDLIYAVPGQNEVSWRETLTKVTKLKPEHISAYSLIVEEGTPFYDIYGGNSCYGGDPDGNKNGGNCSETVDRTSETMSERITMGASEKLTYSREKLPGEDTERIMDSETGSILKTCGYNRYEISNYSLSGYECRHNTGYWTGQQYIGAGLGASSYINNDRYQNESNLQKYINSVSKQLNIKRNIQHLSIEDRMEEFMFLGLRMICGVSKSEFFRQFCVEMKTVYGDTIDRYRQLGLINESGDNVYLSERGLDVSNMVMADFLL